MTFCFRHGIGRSEGFRSCFRVCRETGEQWLGRWWDCRTLRETAANGRDSYNLRSRKEDGTKEEKKSFLMADWTSSLKGSFA